MDPFMMTLTTAHVKNDLDEKTNENMSSKLHRPVNIFLLYWVQRYGP